MNEAMKKELTNTRIHRICFGHGLNVSADLKLEDKDFMPWYIKQKETLQEFSQV